MRDIEIIISEQNGAVIGKLELENSSDFALKLTKAISSIKDIRVRSTSYSLDFDAPNTANNNRLLNGIRYVNHTKAILGNKSATIIADGNQIDKGYLYAYESGIDKGFKLVFKGGNNDWLELIKGIELHELHWRDYITGLPNVNATELYSSARFSVLNAANSDNYDLIYPYINRNNGGEVTSFRPIIHYKALIKAMFTTIGYTVQSTFLESEWMTGDEAFTDDFGNAYTHLGLAIDPAFVMTREQNDLINYLADYKTNVNNALTPPNWAAPTMLGNLDEPTTPNIRRFTRFATVISVFLEDVNSAFSVANSEYTVAQTGNYNIKFTAESDISYHNGTAWVNYNQNVSPFDQRPPNLKMYVILNNTQNYAIDGTVLWSFISPIQTGLGFDISLDLNVGDKISIFAEFIDDAFGFEPPQQFPPKLIQADLNAPSLNKWRLRIKNDSRLTIKARESVSLGDVFRINSHIPKGIKCVDLLQDFKTQFNLMFDADPYRKVVYFEPRDEFYDGGVVDITNKIDLSKAPVLNYLKEYTNLLTFKYATDSNDKYLEQWNKSTDRTYAEYRHFFVNQNRFENGETVIETKLLCPSIQGETSGSNILTSLVKQEWLDADNLGKGVNNKYRPRVFQIVRGQQFDSGGIARRTSSPLIVTVAIMENFANTPTFEGRKLTFIGERGLVWDYYRRTLTNIENGAILEVEMDISLYEFRSWNFRKRYYISEPEELKGEWITESIDNYDVVKEGMTKVKLSRFKDWALADVTGGDGNVNGDLINVQGDVPEPIYAEVNGVIVPVLDNNFQQIYKV